ncbi:MAG: hypothetical protein IBX50_12150 [Marinospirillum sp.]|uniref:hypothetical protein n=1 Tax=Marinospirillum sp. TaxID=2183934 RepID=UPI0019E97092|nr:hypothetical protein [Marinospirillum sp.]MBE0507448.1 hypothetical protein [Marinospirillum sp.]
MALIPEKILKIMRMNSSESVRRKPTPFDDASLAFFLHWIKSSRNAELHESITASGWTYEQMTHSLNLLLYKIKDMEDMGLSTDRELFILVLHGALKPATYQLMLRAFRARRLRNESKLVLDNQDRLLIDQIDQLAEAMGIQRSKSLDGASVQRKACLKALIEMALPAFSGGGDQE